MRAIDSQGGGGDKFAPKGLDWQDYVGDQDIAIHTKYISCGPHGFIEDFMSITSLWKLLIHVWTMWA